MLAADPEARAVGLTYNHVVGGMTVGERPETCELFALAVRGNVVRRRTPVPAREGVDQWGVRGGARSDRSGGPIRLPSDLVCRLRSRKISDEPDDHIPYR